MKLEEHSVERVVFGNYVVLKDEHIFEKFGIHFPSKDYELNGSETMAWPQIKKIINFIINNTDYQVLNISNTADYIFVYFSK